jgi:phosphoribosylamine-glycine ligase
VRFRDAIQVPEPAADCFDVDISAASVSAASQAMTNTERQVAVMKKSRDVQEAQAQALVELIKQAPMPPHVGSLINVVA